MMNACSLLKHGSTRTQVPKISSLLGSRRMLYVIYSCVLPPAFHVFHAILPMIVLMNNIATTLSALCDRRTALFAAHPPVRALHLPSSCPTDPPRAAFAAVDFTPQYLSQWTAHRAGACDLEVVQCVIKLCWWTGTESGFGCICLGNEVAPQAVTNATQGQVWGGYQHACKTR